MNLNQCARLVTTQIDAGEDLPTLDRDRRHLVKPPSADALSLLEADATGESTLFPRQALYTPKALACGGCAVTGIWGSTGRNLFRCPGCPILRRMLSYFDARTVLLAERNALRVAGLSN